MQKESLQLERYDYIVASKVCAVSLGIILILIYAQAIGLYFLLISLIFVFKTENKYLEYAAVILPLINIGIVIQANNFPFIQLGPGLRFNSGDIILLIYSIYTYRLYKMRKVKYYSTKLIFFLTGLSLIYFFVIFIFTLDYREAGTNFLRLLLIPFFYFVYIELFRVAKNIRVFYIAIGIFVILGTLIQFFEVSTNIKFQLPGTEFARIGMEDPTVYSAGILRVYAFSRTTLFAFFLSGLSLSFIVHKINTKISYLFFSVCAISFMLATVRIWFTIIFSVIIFIVFLSSFKYKIGLFKIIFVIIVISLIPLYYFLLNSDYFAFADSILLRIQSIINLGGNSEQDTLAPRLILFDFFWKKFLESPIYGHGFGTSIINNYNNSDLGMINRAINFGLFGLIPLLVFIILYIFKTLSFYWNSQSNGDKAILLSVSALIFSHLIGYVFQLDFWGREWATIMVMILALGDVVMAKYSTE